MATIFREDVDMCKCMYLVLLLLLLLLTVVYLSWLLQQYTWQYLVITCAAQHGNRAAGCKFTASEAMISHWRNDCFQNVM
jgi:hypothetical protein